MHRTWLFAFSFLFVCASGLGQSTAIESQGMQALVAEVRQLRKDLQASNGNALKAQVLLYRLQFQEAAVARASERLNDARGKLADTQRHRTEVAARLKRLEESLDNTETSPADRKEVQLAIADNKIQLENVTADEQQRQAAEMEAADQMRTEQAKLNELEERVGSTGKSSGQSSLALMRGLLSRPRLGWDTRIGLTTLKRLSSAIIPYPCPPENSRICLKQNSSM
jgi:chromosome segregation ATPase